MFVGVHMQCNTTKDPKTLIISFTYVHYTYIPFLQFSYDVKAGVMGLGPTLSVDGTVVETILAGEFSIRLNDTNLNLDELKILSLGNIRVQLKSGNLLRSVSEPFLTTISQLFRARISTSAAGGIKDYIRNLLHYANSDDLFQLKKNINLLLHLQI